MDFRIFKVIIFVFFTTFTLVSFVFAREISIQNRINTVEFTPTATIQFYKLSDKIQEGIKLLEKSPPLAYETRVIKLRNHKTLKTNEVIRKQIDFAILDTSTGGILEKRVWVNESDIQNFKKTGPITFMSADDVNINVQPKQWNSFNSFYEISGRPELVVVANKYPMASNLLGNLPEKSKNKFTEIVYAPYSEALLQPEIVDAGKNYLEKNADQAFAELNEKRIESRSISGQPVTAVVNKDFIKNIILIEHIDPDFFAIAADGGKELTERVLTIIGANQVHAYRYTSSPAGASGLAQFIKSTYLKIVANYPEVGLIRDYSLGMADHVNAIKAMVLFFDIHNQEITNKISRPEVIKQLGITEEMMAAAYNGGPNKVAKSVNKYGLAWLSKQLGLPRARQIFKTETLNYLKKLESIKELNIF